MLYSLIYPNNSIECLYYKRLCKLSLFFVNHCFIHWIGAYVSNRVPNAEIKNASSELAGVPLNVPQGLVLGPGFS